MKKALFLSIFLAIPGFASAEGFTTGDVGESGTLEQCMDRAMRTLTAYANEMGQFNPTIDQGPWTTSAFDVPPGDIDVEIACPYVNNIVVTTLISGHSEGDTQQRIGAIERIMDIWDTNPPMPTGQGGGGGGGGDK